MHLSEFTLKGPYKELAFLGDRFQHRNGCYTQESYNLSPGDLIRQRILSDPIGSDHPTKSDRIPGNGFSNGSDGKSKLFNLE